MYPRGAGDSRVSLCTIGLYIVDIYRRDYADTGDGAGAGEKNVTRDSTIYRRLVTVVAVAPSAQM